MQRAEEMALEALTMLKQAILMVLAAGPEGGMKNFQIGRKLGIYTGYASGNEGHISRTLLERLREDGTVEYDSSTGNWRLLTRK